MGIRASVTSVEAASKPGLYGGHKLTLAVISEKDSGRLIGAQMAGREGVLARLNTMAAAIAGQLTLKDLESLDLGYSPELAALWDPVLIAGRLGRRRC
jgi:NADPH-dependent 2,4-dienoyl-CoA reductase/sulfur reductase-like enzyme